VTPLPPISAPGAMPFGPITGADGVGSATAAPAATASGGFADMLSGAVSGLNDQLISSERLTEQAATGGLADPTVALVAVEKADLAFNTAVQVRNKMIEAWQEISRMQV